MKHITPKRFRQMRHDLGKTQVELARLFGYPNEQMIGRYERGQTAIPGYTKVLLHLLHDQEVNGNITAVQDYVRSVEARRAQ